MRLGIFGGTFDPVHYGHLLLAEYARVACRLDRVWFVPAAIAPHKSSREATPGEQRADMLELAVAENEAFQVSLMELERGGLSYTRDTLQNIKSQQPDAELFLLLGADSLADLPNWRAPDEICTLATPVVVFRPGAPEPDYDVLQGLVPSERMAAIRNHRIDMPLIELSGTEIRRRVAAKRSVRYQTPEAVVEYIARHGLYAAS